MIILPTYYKILKTCCIVNSSKFEINFLNCFILSFVMSKQKASFLSSQNAINKISIDDLVEELKKVEENNQEIRRSFKTDSRSLSIRAGR